MNSWRFFDRLPGLEVSQLPDGIGLGRIQLLLETEASFNGVAAKNGDHLFLGPGGQAVLQLPGADPVLVPLSAEYDFPETEERQAILAIGRALEKLERSQASWLDWVEASPLAAGIPEQATILPFEQTLQRYLWHVKQVCGKPRTQLTVEIERMPVSRARRIPSRSFEFLANHTEDWEYRRLKTVVPRRILSTIPDDLYIFYENQLTTHLVELIHNYLSKRLRQLTRQAENLVDIEAGTHFRQRRVYSLLADAKLVESIKRNVEPTRQALDKLYRAVMGIQDLPLYRIIPSHARKAVPHEVRATNILVNDRHYRFVNLIWRKYLHEKYVKPQSDFEKQMELQDFCWGFDRYCFLLVVKALTELRFSPKQPGGLKIGTSIPLDSPYGEILLQWKQDYSINLFRKDRLILRIVPLAEAITHAEHPSIVLKRVGKLVRALEPKKAGKKKAVKNLEESESPNNLVLYPGMLLERLYLSKYLQRLVNSPGVDLPKPGRLGIIPVSPYELGCIERVGRALRWSIFNDLYKDYPFEINIPTRFEKNLIETTSWLKPGRQRGKAQVYKWVDINSRDVNTHRNLFNDIRGDLVRRGLQANKIEIDRLDQYWNDLQAKLIDLKMLRVCPVCGMLSRQENFHAVENDIFTCTCEETNCATWGLRKCGNCQKTYSFIGFGSLPYASQDLDADWVDRHYGMDVLAAPCPSSPQVRICPYCGKCGQDSAVDGPVCRACKEFRTAKTEDIL